MAEIRIQCNNLPDMFYELPVDHIDAISSVSTFTNKVKEQVTHKCLVSNEQSQLVELLSSYEYIFRDCPGQNHLYTCRFNVTEDVPFKVKPYPIPFSRRPAVETELKRMLDWGIVERCYPLMLIPLSVFRNRMVRFDFV